MHSEARNPLYPTPESVLQLVLPLERISSETAVLNGTYTWFSPRK